MQGETLSRVPYHIHARCFNPLSLCRERRPDPVSGPPSAPFQSTLPMQGETCGPSVACSTMRFQSTLPMQGETVRFAEADTVHRSFNPLSLCRERPTVGGSSLGMGLFQSTLPMQGETLPARSRTCSGRCFNPLSLCRERRIVE